MVAVLLLHFVVQDAVVRCLHLTVHVVVAASDHLSHKTDVVEPFSLGRWNVTGGSINSGEIQKW